MHMEKLHPPCVDYRRKAQIVVMAVCAHLVLPSYQQYGTASGVSNLTTRRLKRLTQKNLAAVSVHFYLWRASTIVLYATTILEEDVAGMPVLLG